MSKYKVTNGEYLEFVRAGATPPHFWTWREGQWHWRAMSGAVPLPMDWSVYVTREIVQVGTDDLDGTAGVILIQALGLLSLVNRASLNQRGGADLTSGPD